MENGINVLSLFNGMGCIWHALEDQNIKVNKRFSSEIEKYPNQANDLLYPDTIQLGDVRNVKGSDLGFIHVLAGGSPCQSFSFAGKRKGMAAKLFVPKTYSDEEMEEHNSNVHESGIGKIFYDIQDFIEYKNDLEKISDLEVIEILTLEHYLELKDKNFEFEGQSYLFWEYMRIFQELKEINTDIKFLLENVIMGSKWQKVITQAIGINPIRINAALVSAQNRNRLFWTNIHTEQDGFFGDLKCIIPQPKDKGILLKDILETLETSEYETQEEFDAYMEKYFLSDKMMNYLNSRKDNFNSGKINYKTENDIASCLNASVGLDISDNIIIDSNRKGRCFTAGGNSGGLHSQMDLIVHDTGNTNTVEVREVRQLNESLESGGKQPCQQNIIYDANGISPALCAEKSDLIIQTDVFGADYRTDEGLRIRQNGKSGTLAARARNDESCGQLAVINKTIRRLTPREAFRLQSVSEDKIDMLINSGISDTQLYKMAGNGWNIKVISHILSFYNK